jgi:hypothetical protein
MAESQPNGLASLSAQRQRARRSMPPPRHPVALSAPAKADKARHEDPQITQPPIDAPVTAGSSSSEPIQPLSAAEVGAPVKVTLYVDRQADDFMEAARVEGLVARPKVDISRSAVVRLALRRLMSDMTASQVKALLEGQEVRSTGPGRKRR